MQQHHGLVARNLLAQDSLTCSAHFVCEKKCPLISTNGAYVWGNADRGCTPRRISFNGGVATRSNGPASPRHESSLPRRFLISSTNIWKALYYRSRFRKQERRGRPMSRRSCDAADRVRLLRQRRRLLAGTVFPLQAARRARAAVNRLTFREPYPTWTGLALAGGYS